MKTPKKLDANKLEARWSKWVKESSDDEEHDPEDLKKAFRAIFRREPTDKDYEEGLWSHLCAAIAAED